MTQKLTESFYRDRLSNKLYGSKTEYPCSSGYIDIYTPKEIIEVKTYGDWKQALGQVLMYGLDFPNHSKRVHLIVEPNNKKKFLTEIEAIKSSYSVYNVELSYELAENNIIVYRRLVFEDYEFIFRYKNDLINELERIKLSSPTDEDLIGRDRALILGLANETDAGWQQFDDFPDRACVLSRFSIERKGRSKIIHKRVLAVTPYEDIDYKPDILSEWLKLNVNTMAKIFWKDAEKIYKLESKNKPPAFWHDHDDDLYIDYGFA